MTDLTIHEARRPSDPSPEAYDDFKKWVMIDKLKPSQVVKKVIEKYPKKLTCFDIVNLMEFANPDIMVNQFSGRLIDSNYPDENCEDYYTDEFFDSQIERAIEYSNKCLEEEKKRLKKLNGS
jgi:hypothetical protein